MNMLTRAEAIAECYPRLQSDQIAPYMVTYTPTYGRYPETVDMWLPIDPTQQQAVLADFPRYNNGAKPECVDPIDLALIGE